MCTSKISEKIRYFIDTFSLYFLPNFESFIIHHSSEQSHHQGVGCLLLKHHGFCALNFRDDYLMLKTHCCPLKGRKKGSGSQLIFQDRLDFVGLGFAFENLQDKIHN
jgi:hypothetical protein